ncbi:MAG: enoyl-CoA hydratase/isomerase family protein [Alphaproteobacteria bacterium]|nr:enoyl-CoA hydratase/isomerase family protein [Alphaproteobacteria bacterium]
MSYEHVKFSVKDGIGHLVLARDDTRNALAVGGLVEEMLDVLHRVETGSDARVLILSAEGSSFSAGGNLREIADPEGPYGGGPGVLQKKYVLGIQRLPKALHALNVPTIAAVQGPAIGAGCDLALFCDIVLASTEAKFSEAFINLGIISGDGGTWALSRLVNTQRAAELLFTGRVVDGREAADIGLALECLEPDRLLPRAFELAAHIASRPQVALRFTKILLRQALTSSLDDLLDTSSALQAICHNTEDHREAVAAFLEKRKPNPFKGR